MPNASSPTRCAARCSSSRRRELLRALGGGALALAAPEGFAQSRFPSRPVRLIVTVEPGNVLDATARLIAPRLADRLGQPVTVENASDANTALAALARTAPDGHTLAAVPAGQLVIAPHLDRALGYDPLKDFEPVALAATSYFVLATPRQGPFRTVAEMVGWAKAHPGKLTVATPGPGSAAHFAFEELRTQADFSYRHVQYQNPTDLANDLAFGIVQVTIGSSGALYRALRGGKLKLLATTAANRIAPYVDLPTAAEAMPGFTAGDWLGIVAPAHTPREIVQRLNGVIGEIVKSAATAEKLTGTGLIATPATPERFAEILQRDYAHYGRLWRSIAAASRTAAGRP